MTWRRVAVYVSEGGDLTDLATLAAGLARTLKADLIGLATANEEPPAGASSLTLDPAQARERELTQLLQRMQVQFRAKTSGVEIDWRGAIFADATDFVLRQAVLADLLIAEHQPEQTPKFSRLDMGRLVLEAGRPVLALPPHTDKLEFDRILVGYKPSREGRAAVQAALPMLRLARRVLIVGIGEEVSSSDLDGVARHLARHEIEAVVRHIAERDGSITSALNGLAADDGSQLLVSGAYGRSRARERLFGGVTRDLLSSARLPCLLFH